MVLPAPNLDDRSFQSLVDEAKRMVQQRCPEWTDHNVSDPGVTLIETFAYMVEQLLWRLNRVPERTYIKFLDLLGVPLEPPTAAHVPVTFWLSAPQGRSVIVPDGTQVATRRTEEEAVVFTTVEELDVVPCAFDRAVTEQGAAQVDQTDALLHAGGFPCFGPSPQPGDCFYVGLSNAVPRCVVRLRLGCVLEGAGVDPRWPPIAWEAWDGRRWAPCEVIEDATGGLNRSGDVVLHLPRTHRAHVGVVQHLAGWVRCRLVPAATGQPTYELPPRITRVDAFTVGGTADAVHADVVRNEVLGASTGTAAQRFTLEQRPVVPSDRPDGYTLEVRHPDGGPTTVWRQVDQFGESGPADRHFVLDGHLGEVVLGPAVRDPDGSLRSYGAVPDKGVVLRLAEYRTGGGRRGNVARGAISVLKSSVPFIASVENRRPGRGGTDGETVDNAKLRGPLLLRARQRAVTAADYEHLALAAAKEVARARCIPAGSDGVEAGTVRLLLVPAVEDGEHGTLDFGRMDPTPDLLGRVVRHLDERRVAGARLVVEPADYVGFTVVATLRPRPDVDPHALRADALEALYGWFHPLRGGLDGTGWPFGRSVVEGDAYGVLQRLPGVDVVEQVRLFPADPVDQRRGAQTDRIAVGPNHLVFPWGHQVLVRSS